MVTTFRLRTTAYAAGLAAVVALVGCGDGGVQAGGPSTQVPAKPSTAVVPSTTSPTTTAPADPVLARIPAAARPETSAGAEAFGQFFLESLNMAARTPDPELLDGLFQPECETCVAMRDSVADLKRTGRQHTADSVRVVRTDPIVFAPERRAVRVEIDQMAVDVKDPSGRLVYRTEAGKYAFAVTLVFTDRHWVITKLQTIA